MEKCPISKEKLSGDIRCGRLVIATFVAGVTVVYASGVRRHVPGFRNTRPALARMFAYVLTDEITGFETFQIRSDGHLLHAYVNNPLVGRYPNILETAPEGHAVYSGGIGDEFEHPSGYLELSPVTATGALGYEGSRVLAGASPWGVVFGRNGHIVYVYSDTSILAYSVSPDGDLCPLTVPAIQPGENAVVSADPLGRFVWIARKGGRIDSYRVKESGALAYVGDLQLSDSPLAISWLPGGKYTAYLDLPDTGVVCVARVGPDGRPTLMQSARVVPPRATYNGILAIHPSGRFLYCSYGTGSSFIIAEIPIKPGGRITVTKAIPLVARPVSKMAITPDGRFAYTLGGGTNIITQYRIAVDGKLTRCSTQVLSSADYASAIAIAGY